MFKSMLLKEIGRHLKNIPFYIFGLVIMFLVLLYAKNTDPSTQILGLSHGKEFNVAAIKVAKMFNNWSIASIFFIMVFVARSVVRDFQVNIHDFFFTSRIRKKSYLGARFLGSYLGGLFLLLFVPLGLVLGNLMLSPDLQAPLHWQTFIYPFIIMVIPNLLFISAFLFSMSSLTRQTISTYIGSIVLIMLYVFALAGLTNVKNDAVRIILDPFGLNALNIASQFWTTYEMNNNFMPLTNLLLLNRLIWVLVSIGLLIWTFRKFKMTHDLDSHVKKVRTLKVSTPEIPELLQKPEITPLNYSSANFKKVTNMVILEWKRILLHPAFIIITVLGLSQLISNFMGNIDALGSNVYPLTSWFLNQLIHMWMYMIPIIILFGGLIVWREKDNKTHEIYHTLPLTDFQRCLSKLIALIGIQFVYLLLTMLTGIFIQLVVYQYTTFEFGLYFKRLFLLEMFNYIQLAVMVIFIQVLVRNKLLGYFISAAMLLGDIIIFDVLKFDFNLLRWAHFPKYIYSNLNGFAAYSKLLTAYGFYWLFFTLIILTLAILFWKSSENDSFKQRLNHALRKMTPKIRFNLITLLLIFLLLGGYIAYNRYILNNYISTKGFDLAMADYERQCSKYLHTPQPSVIDFNLNVDLYPSKQAALIQGSLTLKNNTLQNIDTLFISLWPNKRADLKKFTLSVPNKEIVPMQDYRLGIFGLNKPLLPGDSLVLSFNVDYQTKGFTDNNPETSLVQNGTVMYFGGKETPSYIPQIGINKDLFLKTDYLRKKYNLPNEPVLPTLEKADRKIGFSNLDLIRFHCQVSTEKGQIAITNGELLKQWDEGDRSYFIYEPAIPITNEIALTSGKYLVIKDTYLNANVEVYYDAKHAYNIDNIIKGFKTSLELNSQFSAYPHKTLRVVEIPAYASQFGARAFPMLYIWNEEAGFISRANDSKKVDMVFGISAHEMAHHWWGYYLLPADAEGLYLPVESMAQFMEAMAIEKDFGKEKVYTLLDTSRKQYLKGRSRAKEGEAPMSRIRHKQSHLYYEKGIIQLYTLREYIGAEPMYKALKTFYDQYAHTTTNYPLSTDMIDALRAETPDSLKYLMDDMFLNITLYDLKTTSAKTTKLPDGKYKTVFEVETQKIYADPNGKETVRPFHDYVFVGLFDKEDKSLYYQIHKLNGKKSSLSIITATQPSEAGIDPHGLLIDKNIKDNKMMVKFE